MSNKSSVILDWMLDGPQMLNKKKKEKKALSSRSARAASASTMRAFDDPSLET